MSEQTQLPYCHNALVHPEKIIGYLLSFTHEDGKSKAKFFQMYGFYSGEAEPLKGALLLHACSAKIVSKKMTIHGMQYAIDGEIISPDGRNPIIRSVWIIHIGSKSPRFVSAYPQKKIK